MKRKRSEEPRPNSGTLGFDPIAHMRKHELELGDLVEYEGQAKVGILIGIEPTFRDSFIIFWLDTQSQMLHFPTRIRPLRE